MSTPLVSIVTVNRNMGSALAGTLDSVLAQDFSAFELILIDGASTDDSATVIAAHADRIAYWISEPDRNLYDAMNKGVAAARGEWVLFMNAGDHFAAPDVLSRVFATTHDDADLIYGHHVRSYPGKAVDRLILAEMPKVLSRRMFCSHQSLFTRRTLLREHPFAVDLLAADYDAVLGAWMAGRRFEPVDCVIARTEAGGRSDTNRLQSLRERMAIAKRYGLLTPGLRFYYQGLMIRAVLAVFVKTLLPGPVLRTILRRRPIKGLG